MSKTMSGIPETADELITEAERYLKNAASTLKSIRVEDGKYYSDGKYVSTASGTAYMGVLLALNAIHVKKYGNTSFPQSVDGYRELIKKVTDSQLKRKLLKEFNDVYIILHLMGYYRSVVFVDKIKEGMQKAINIINLIDEYLKSGKKF